MKKILVSALLLLCALPGVMAQNAEKAKLSAFTQQYLLATKKQSGNKPVPGYVYKKINNRPYISAMIKVGSGLSESALSSVGVFVGTKAGSIWTVQIPVEHIPDFIQTPGIAYIQLDRPIIPYLDSARKQTRADSAQAGINLPQRITGAGVLVGVIDAGFDFTNPAFYDTTHSAYRIRRVWAQKIAGTPPSGFAYGNELTDSNAMRALGYDTAILSHGTHVTGIAAGSGYGSNATNSRFRGMAFQSDIALVGIMPAPSEWISAGESDIVDGMSYLFNYGASIGEPTVINLSWGSTLGPHDGSSLFNQACDALTGPGKIFVCAAGNNGEDTVHLQKTFSTTDTTVSTFVTFSPGLDSNNLQTWVDIWGDTGNAFCINVRLFDTTAAIDSTGYICVSADTTRTFYLIGSNGDTCLATITVIPSDYNDKPHAVLYLYSKITDNICLTTKASSGMVNMWEGYVIPPEGYYGYMKALGYPWAVSGDANMTVSDIGCTKSAITAGAYTSKVSFTNISHEALYYPGGEYGHIAPFSSFGPTEDARIKPDITAPGFALASSVNSFDTSYLPGGTNYSSIISADTIGGTVYNYAMLAGTSMASPCTAGIVAMMLQLNPSMAPDDVKSIINATAITDRYTGTLPATGTTTWGHGKINAYGAVSYLAAQESVKNVNMDPANCILYPNPNHGTFTISYLSKAQEPLKVEVADVTGRLVSQQVWAVNSGYNTHQFNMQKLPQGTYFIKVSSSAGYNVIKMIVD